MTVLVWVSLQTVFQVGGRANASLTEKMDWSGGGGGAQGMTEKGIGCISSGFCLEFKRKHQNYLQREHHVLVYISL